MKCILSPWILIFIGREESYILLSHKKIKSSLLMKVSSFFSHFSLGKCDASWKKHVSWKFKIIFFSLLRNPPVAQTHPRYYMLSPMCAIRRTSNPLKCSTSNKSIRFYFWGKCSHALHKLLTPTNFNQGLIFGYPNEKRGLLPLKHQWINHINQMTRAGSKSLSSQYNYILCSRYFTNSPLIGIELYKQKTRFK